VAEWRAVQFVTQPAPIRQVLVHQPHKPRAMAPLQQMRQLVRHDVLQ
jgi:hypothetical protein